jgi:hypothetical protein
MDLPPLSPEDWVTQYGNVREGGFRKAPRQGVERAVSVIRGRLSIEEATWLVRRRWARSGDAVRYGKVGTLQGAGFSLSSEPVPLNPEHCLVDYPDVWDERVASQSDRCFETPLVREKRG